jgi:hypothetical protein
MTDRFISFNTNSFLQFTLIPTGQNIYFPNGIDLEIIDNLETHYPIGKFPLKTFHLFLSQIIEQKPQTLYDLKQIAKEHITTATDQQATDQNITIKYI